MTTKQEHRDMAEALLAANKPKHALVHAILALSAPQKPIIRDESQPKLPSQEVEFEKPFFSGNLKSHCCFAGCTLLACGHCIQENCFCRYKVAWGNTTIIQDNSNPIHYNDCGVAGGFPHPYSECGTTPPEKDCGV